MGEEEEYKQIGGPKPLSGEAPSAEIEIDLKKKAQDKKTVVNFRDKSYIEKTVKTPKDAPAQPDNFTPTEPKDNINDIRDRLAKEPESLNPGGGSSSIGGDEGPDADDCEMYADLAIELIDWVMIMLIQWYGKDPKEDDYKSDENKKKKLKKMLAKMLMRVGKKYPVAVFFFGALILMYVPAARKAHAHKQKVEEERAAAEAAEAKRSKRGGDEEGGASSSGVGSRRRRLKQDPEIVDAEEIK